MEGRITGKRKWVGDVVAAEVGDVVAEVGDVVAAESWKELPDWLKELGEDLQMEILGRLPAEDVYRYRRVCSEWNNLLSSNYFITHTWPDATINKQPLLLLCDILTSNPCMAFSFYTRTWKTCFSLSFSNEERNNEFKCRGSAAGLVLLQRQMEIRVCNPYTGNSIQLPLMLAITLIHFICIAEADNNNNDGDAYKVVAVGFGFNGEIVVEMYDSFEKTWKIFRPTRELTMLYGFSDFVCCEGSYYCILTNPWRILGFTIPTLDEELEPRTLVVPIQEPMLKCLLELQLAICGSRLLVVAPIEDEVVVVCELESPNKQCHPLSTTNDRTSWAWKEIARMPPTLWDDFKCVAYPQRYRCTGVGDNVCFTAIHEMSIEVVVYNLGTHSWSRLPSCPWRNQPWSHGRFRGAMAMTFQPRLNTCI